MGTLAGIPALRERLGRKEMLLFSKIQAKLRRLADRIYELLVRRDIELAEFYGAIIAVVCAVWLLAPWWAVMRPDRPQYRLLAESVGEQVWGAVLLLTGCMQLYGILHHNLWARRTGTILAAAVWMFMFVLILRADASALVCPVTGMLATGSVIGYWRQGRQGAWNRKPE